MGKQQKSRTPKTSQGKHGGGGKGRRLTGIEKINFGGGLMVGVQKRWKEDNRRKAEVI